MCRVLISRCFFALAFLAVYLSLGVTQGLAQSTTNGAIAGTVTDAQGLAVPSASVTIVNVGTDKKNQTTTNDFGQFRVVELQPGMYTVTVSATSFATVVRSNVFVEVGRMTELQIPLAVKGTTQTVEVTSEAPLVTTTQEDFSTNVNQKLIDELPTNGRRWSNFVVGTPGVSPDGNFGLMSFRGISGLLNNNTVDGGDNNQAFFSEEKGRTRINYVISLASVQEFQVNTSNYSAEYGRAAGGVVNAVTKSGTNNLHGSAFYYLRNNRIGATNPFTVQTQLVNGVPTSVRIKPKDIRHQFGGALGGPIQKDKLFFFFSWDQQRREFPAVASTGSATFLNPITVQAPVAPRTCATSGLSAGETLSCRSVTQPQVDAGLAYLRGLTGLVPRRGDQYILFPKVDWRIKSNHTLSASYNRLHWDSPGGIQATGAVFFRGIASFGDDFVRADSLIVRLSSNVSANIINEARFQYGRDNEFETAQKPGPGEPTTGPNGSSPAVSMGGGNGMTIGKPNFLDRRAYPDEKRYQWADTVSIAHGKHFVKFGADINHVNDVLDNLFRESGEYSYSTLDTFLTDFAKPKGCPTSLTDPTPVPCYSSYNQGFGPTAFQFSTNDYGFFVQDDWRVRRRLTLSGGLRYEYEQLPSPQVPNLPAVPLTGSFPTDKDSFGPRLGFAWDVKGDGKTSLRGGYGIYYGRIINSTISNAITNTASAQSQIQFVFNPTTAGAPVYPNTLPPPTGASSIKPNAVFFSPNMENPLIHQIDLTLEHEVGWHTVLSASYLGSVGRYLPTFIDRNLNPPSSTVTYTVSGGNLDGRQFTLPFFTGPRPNTNFGQLTEITSSVTSHYSALVLQVNRRLTRGVEFQTNYTWSHATDNGQASQTFTSSNAVFNPFDLSQERGNSSFDTRHRFAARAVWSPEVFKNGNTLARSILNGYTFAPIVSISKGPHYSPSVSGSAPGSTVFGINGGGGTSRFPFLGRNSFDFPSIKVVDLRVSRRFHITEKARLEVLAEAFNLFNHPNTTGVNDTLYFIPFGTKTLSFNQFFGAPQNSFSAFLRERQIQFAARFEF